MARIKQLSELEKLKAEWDLRLKQDGFNDIEDARGNLKVHNRRTIAFDFRDDIRDYFIALDHYITRHEEDIASKIPNMHLQILKLHSSGMHNCEIQKVVKYGQTKIKKILRHYKKIILNEHNDPFAHL